MRNALLLLLPLLGACEKDPVWFGYWEIVEASRAGVTQSDMGEMEVFRNGDMAFFLRYQWDGAGWSPDPTPYAQFGQTNAIEVDAFDAYREKGETYDLYLSPFCIDVFEGRLDVAEYTANTAVLRGKANPWPGRPDEELFAIELVISR